MQLRLSRILLGLVSGPQESPAGIAGFGARQRAIFSSCDPCEAAIVVPLLRRNSGSIVAGIERIELVYGREAQMLGILGEESLCVFRTRKLGELTFFEMSDRNFGNVGLPRNNLNGRTQCVSSSAEFFSEIRI